MKPIIYFILVVASMFSTAMCANAQNRFDKADKCSRFQLKSRYYISNNNVFFNGVLISGASVSSFRILGDCYSKDSWNVYFCAHKVAGASPSSFQLIGDGYAKDSWNVYFCGDKIAGTSPSSFQLIGDGYAKDSWTV